MTFALSLAACGDNKHQIFEDAAVEDGAVDAPPDAPPDALMCGAAPNMNCSGTCANTNTDNNNCGTCGNACTNGETCTSGICCAPGLANCGGQCVNLQTADAHCGMCDTVCDTGANEFCQNGTCCGGTQTACGNQCFDTQVDDGHCGNCNTACSGNTPDCDAGKCCPTGWVNCGGTCFDPDSDEAHCGGCVGSGLPGTACDTNAGETCTMGHCCATGTVSCDGTTCTDTDTDLANCGACGTTCAGTCNEGHCCTGGAGSKSCDGSTCTNTNTDNNNCGDCSAANGGNGDVCATPGESCQSGLCCGPGQSVCNGVCVDKLSDNANCGMCGTVCSGGTPVCSGGTCSGACGPNEQNCSGDCVDPDADHDHCGGCLTACGPNEVCNNGGCAATCSGAGETVCNGDCVNLQTDPNHCGVCNGGVCPLGDECVNGVCQLDCPIGETLCSGVCVNTQTSLGNCGMCGTPCNGTCTNGICCAPGETLCGAVCKNLQTDPLHCGSCSGTGSTCGGADPFCKTGLCCGSTENHCTTPTNACSDPLTDNFNCGGCATGGTGVNCNLMSKTCSDGICCGANQYASTDGASKICCPLDQVNCGGTCVDLSSPASCGTSCQNKVACGNGFACDSNTHTCTLTCASGRTNCGGTCVDTLTDEFNCGPVLPEPSTSCDNACVSGTTCTGGVCGACPGNTPNICNNICVNKQTDPANCGNCGTICAIGNACSAGKCCPTGTTNCNGTCVDITSDEANCGACSPANGGNGAVCTGTSTCQSGACTCGFGQVLCGSTCVTPSIDAANCGGCANVPTAGAHVCTAGQFCVSNSCVSTCPAPLVGCSVTQGVANPKECINPLSDSDNCGGCAGGAGVKCPAGQGCVAGACKAIFPVLTATTLAKCDGGGPPLILPTDTTGGTVCSGNLAGTSFTFGLCSRTRIGPLSQPLFSDAFNSLYGAYKPSCTSDADCGTGGHCVGDPSLAVTDPYHKTCAGGGVGVNGTLSPVANNSAATHVGGDFWAFGSFAWTPNNNVTVKQNVVMHPGIDYSKTHRVFGDFTIGTASMLTGGQADLRIDGNLFHPTCTGLPADPQDIDIRGTGGTNGCTVQAWDDTRLPPCGRDKDLVPVQTIVDYFRNPAHNDNAAVGLRYDALAAPPQDVRLELPCGYYYLNSIGGSSKITILVKGRTGIFIGGAVSINTDVVFDVEPTASLDMFIGGVMRAQPVYIGSPAYPRLTRIYMGNDAVVGSGPCLTNGDCGNGLCTACPTPIDVGTSPAYAACSGVAGTCTGGSSLSDALFMSQGGSFNGLLYAGYGNLQASNNVEMYGSIFVDGISQAGPLTIHYDNGAATTGDECPPLPPSTSCESCRQCNNQACNSGTCGSCTADSQCCPPLHCSSGTCTL